jgi:Cof subfamily protein (haloacid dehalogenase superfamily)
MSIRLVCIDVDGTLVGASGLVPAEVWPAANKLRNAGILIALASGRPAFGIAREHAERLDPRWHIFQNGASLVNLQTGESRSTPLPAASVARLIQQARAERRDLELYADLEYAIESHSERSSAHAALLGVPFAPRPLESLAGPIVRAQWLIAHDDLHAVRNADASLEFWPAGSPAMPDTTFVSLTGAGVGKASAVRALAAIHGIDLADVMFVGDGRNDVEALRIVGTSVAMGNAEAEAKAVAHHHVGHVDAGGLVMALALVP